LRYSDCFLATFDTGEPTVTKDQLNHLLRAVMDMEHTTKERLSPDSYWAMSALAQECEAPQFVIEYFAYKAVCAEPTTQE
jgi:hypothetical protein